jgi:DNA-binding HxlR family transcriptional regulator
MSPAASDHRNPPQNFLLAKIEGRWTLQILLCLRGGELRFTDLKAAIPGISSNVLTDRIRALEAEGLVERRYLPPPVERHLYALGPLAVCLKPVLDALATWRGDKHGTSSPTSRADRS